MKYRYLLFDFDGTVADNSRGIYNCIRYALDKMDLPHPDAATLRSFVGPSLFDSFLRHYGPDPARAEELVRLYRERYAPTGKYEVRLYPGIPACLAALRAAGYETAVCSSKPLPFVKDIARHLKIDDLFSFYSCPDFRDTDSDKTRLIGDCLAFFGAKKEEALMIGDTHFDMEAAKKAGMASLGVTYGFSEPGELARAGADLLAADVPEMERLIRGIPA